MPKPLKIIIILSAALLLLSLAAMIAIPMLSPRNHRPNPLAPDAMVADVGLSIPDFSLTTQDGNPITRDALLNHITIVSFIFTHCPNPCPMMTGTMADLHKALAANGAADVRFLCISVDPAHDTPAAMREYAQHYDADFSRWTFATAHAHDNAQQTIRSIVGEGLKFAIEEDPSRPITAPDGVTMTQIVHPSWFVLVGPSADVLGLYRFDDPDAMQSLQARAKAAAQRIRK